MRNVVRLCRNRKRAFACLFEFNDDFLIVSKDCFEIFCPYSSWNSNLRINRTGFENWYPWSFFLPNTKVWFEALRWNYADQWGLLDYSLYLKMGFEPLRILNYYQISHTGIELTTCTDKVNILIIWPPSLPKYQRHEIICRKGILVDLSILYTSLLGRSMQKL